MGDAPVEAHIDGKEDLHQSDIIDDGEGVVVQPAKPMPQPRAPTAAAPSFHVRMFKHVSR